MELTISKNTINKLSEFMKKNGLFLIAMMLLIISILFYAYYTEIGYTLSYNDARSHLNISRRVVEGLKPGFAQLGSVWLPLPHVLMFLTVWNDYMWHTGLAGSIVSMISFVGTGLLIYKFLERLHVSWIGRVFGVFVFALNLNILYLQSTAMTELLLLMLMTAGAYYLVIWSKYEHLNDLLKSAVFIMLSTLVRYDGWFLLITASAIISFLVFTKTNFKKTEGVAVLFGTLASFGIFLWLLWNLMIFKDPLYFAFGPFSAHAQQSQLDAAGELLTKGNLYLSIKYYAYAVFYNSYTVTALFGLFGLIAFVLDKSKKREVRFASLVLAAPLAFNIIALYLGHSVLFVPPLSGNSLFNVRYGVMLMPSIAVFSGYLVDRIKELRWVVIGLFLFVTVFAFLNFDAVSMDDAIVGSSGKNVAEVSGWLNEHAYDKEGFVLISAASHDAIIFSSGLPMTRFIHEGTGIYWESATTAPDKWARWIIMRTHDDNDLTFKEIKDSKGFECCYSLVGHYPFADIYELREEYVPDVYTKPIFSRKDNK